MFYGNVIITCEGLRILPYAQYLWSLSSQGTLACHIYCHGASVYKSHIRWDVTPSHIAEPLAVDLSLAVLATYVCSGWDFNTRSSACAANTFTHCTTTSVRRSSVFLAYRERQPLGPVILLWPCIVFCHN